MNAPSSIASVTLCSAARLDHLRPQLRALATTHVRRIVVWVGDDDPPPLDAEDVRRVPPGPAGLRLARARNVGALATTHVRRIVVWVGDDDPPPLDAEDVRRVPPGPAGLRLARGRNVGAQAARDAGAELLVFLDADCVPGPDLVARYAHAHDRHPDAVLCGAVTYLPPGIDATDPAALAAARNPHPARPSLPDGVTRRADADEYALFWSLSFAVGAHAWRRIGGFHEEYEGYGGEDTDFAFALREAGVPMWWVGGADAYHQHHETSSPPWQHLDDILRNGRLFAERWGQWPMQGWLDRFAAAGAIRRVGDGWRRVGP